MPFVNFFNQKNNFEYNSLYIYIQLIYTFFSLIILGVGLCVYNGFDSCSHLNYMQILSSIFLLGSFLVFDFIRKYLIARRKLIVTLTIDSIVYITQIIAICVLYYQKIHLPLYKVYSLLSIIFFIGYLIGLFSSDLVKVKLKNHHEDLKEAWRYSKWLISSAFLTFSSTNIFFIFCGLFLGAASLGAVRITQNLMGVFNVLGQFIENYLPVKLVKLFQEKEISKINSLLFNNAITIIALLCIFLVICVFFSEDLYGYLYGYEFIKYSYLLNWFIATYILIFINQFLRYGLRTIGATKPIFISYLINSVISLVTVFPLLKNYELSGLVIGMIITQITSILYLKKSYSSKIKLILKAI